MKATFVLLANNETENMGRKLMLEAHQKAGLGFEMARLPHHVSLKQPFKITDLSAVESFFDEFVSQLSPVTAHLLDVQVWPSQVFGYDSGVMVIKVQKSEVLKGLHQQLNNELEQRFGNSSADYDGEAYTFHMTIAIGGKPFDNYQRAYELLERKTFDQEVLFDEVGLFYYDEDHIQPGTYFCYKRVKLLK